MGIDIDSTGIKETLHVPPMDRDKFRASILSPLSSLIAVQTYVSMSFFMAQAQPAPISLASQHVYMAFSLELAALAPAEDRYLNFSDSSGKFCFRPSGIWHHLYQIDPFSKQRKQNNVCHANKRFTVATLRATSHMRCAVSERTNCTPSRRPGGGLAGFEAAPRVYESPCTYWPLQEERYLHSSGCEPATNNSARP